MNNDGLISPVKWPLSAILCFVILAYILSIPAIYVVVRSGDVAAYHGFAVHAIMWCPAIAALITCVIYKIGFEYLGFNFPKWKFIWAAYLIPLSVFCVAYGSIGLSGLVPMRLSGFSAEASKSLHLGSFSSIVALALVATIAVIQDCAATMGEEIGWRGLLVPALAQRVSFFATAMISGLIWAVWHYPAIFTMGFGSVGALGPSTLLFTIDVLFLASLMAWLRLKSGSIWPTIIYHASNNVFGGRIFETLPATPSIWERISKIAVEGVVLIIILVLSRKKARQSA